MDEEAKQSSDLDVVSAVEPSESSAVAVAKDIGMGITEIPRAVVGGVLKATEEAGEVLHASV